MTYRLVISWLCFAILIAGCGGESITAETKFESGPSVDSDMIDPDGNSGLIALEAISVSPSALNGQWVADPEVAGESTTINMNSTGSGQVSGEITAVAAVDDGSYPISWQLDGNVFSFALDAVTSESDRAEGCIDFFQRSSSVAVVDGRMILNALLRTESGTGEYDGKWHAFWSRTEDYECGSDYKAAEYSVALQFNITGDTFTGQLSSYHKNESKLGSSASDSEGITEMPIDGTTAFVDGELRLETSKGNYTFVLSPVSQDVMSIVNQHRNGDFRSSIIYSHGS